jgi:hypothetical protein
MFLVCSSSIFDIVMIDNEFMHKIAKRLIQYSSGLGGRLYVSEVLDIVYLQLHSICWA